MPHIRALFADGMVDHSAKDFLLAQKKDICRVVAEATGYSVEQIALFPEMIEPRLRDMSENMLPLEFIIDAGSKCADGTELIGEEIVKGILQLAGASKIHFGVWLRAYANNHYAEHNLG